MRPNLTAAAFVFAGVGAILVAACSGNPSSNVGTAALPAVRGGMRAADAGANVTLALSVAPRTAGATRVKKLVVTVDSAPSTTQTFRLRSVSCVAKKSGSEYCLFPLAIHGGEHALQIVTASGPKVLSTTNVIVNVPDCSTTTIPVALYMKPAKFVVASKTNLALGSVKNGFDSQQGSGSFVIFALDKAREAVLGNPAPSIVLSSSASQITVTDTAPNTFSATLPRSFPFDNEVKSVMTARTALLRERFDFTVEWSTLPTATPSPTPAPCSTTPLLPSA